MSSVRISIAAGDKRVCGNARETARHAAPLENKTVAIRFATLVWHSEWRAVLRGWMLETADPFGS